MQFSTLLVALAASTVSASAMPDMALGKRTARLVSRSGICPGIDSPNCCQLDVDGIADVTCESPSGTPSNKDDLTAMCAAIGSAAKCCTLVLDGTGVVCNDP